MHFIEGVVAGLAVGVFCPSIARKIKALWVKYTQKGTTAVSGVVNNEIKKL
jgi:hypothetical protein